VSGRDQGLEALDADWLSNEPWVKIFGTEIGDDRYGGGRAKERGMRTGRVRSQNILEGGRLIDYTPGQE
jgi:hypothetical protein